jgi:hypothetical protein
MPADIRLTVERGDFLDRYLLRSTTIAAAHSVAVPATALVLYMLLSLIDTKL